MYFLLTNMSTVRISDVLNFICHHVVFSTDSYIIEVRQTQLIVVYQIEIGTAFFRSKSDHLQVSRRL